MEPVVLSAGWDNVLRIVVVGALGYAALVVLLRTTGKRTLSRLNAFDFVVTVALGAVFGSALTSSTVGLVEMVTAFSVLVLLQFLATTLGVRSRRFARLVTASPRLLWFRGQFLHDVLRAERVTEDEVVATARLHGLGSLAEAEAVVMEADGRFSVVKASSTGDGSALGPVAGR